MKKKKVKAKKSTKKTLKNNKKAKKSVTKKASKKVSKKTSKKVSKKIPKKVSAKKSSTKKISAKKKQISTKKKTSQPSSKKNSDKKFKIKLIPLRDRILVAKEGLAEKTPGGLYIPEIAADRPSQGKVMAVGKGAFSKRGKLRPLDVQVGDKVLYSKYAGSEVKLNGEDFLLLTESEVLGIVES